MRKIRLAFSVFLLAATPARAFLAPGAAAPDFTLPAALAGKSFTFHLAEALKKGPVVVYFYPKSFTAVCTLEAHAFAEAAPDFARAGASLIGVSHDDLATQLAFFSRECRDAFPVAADAEGATIKAFDVRLLAVGPDLAQRVSYVVAPDGKILFALRSDDPAAHVDKTLAAVRAWRVAHPQ